MPLTAIQPDGYAPTRRTLVRPSSEALARILVRFMGFVLHPIDWIVIGLYFVMIVAVGLSSLLARYKEYSAFRSRT